MTRYVLCFGELDARCPGSGGRLRPVGAGAALEPCGSPATCLCLWSQARVPCCPDLSPAAYLYDEVEYGIQSRVDFEGSVELAAGLVNQKEI